MIITELFLSVISMSIIFFSSQSEYDFLAGWFIIGSTTAIITIHFLILLKGVINMLKTIIMKKQV